jgi:hypothetical protein
MRNRQSDRTNPRPDRQLGRRFAWGAALTVITAASSMAVACGTPFAALAALGALYLPRRDAFVLILVNWLVNQAVGFSFLHYPMNWDSYREGIDVGIAAQLAAIAAMLAHRALRGASASVKALGAFAAAFITYEAALFILSPADRAGDFAAPVVAYIFCVNAAAFVGLSLLNAAAAALGLIARSGSAFKYPAAVPRGDAGDRP